MSIPTEPIGSIPRPPQLIEAIREFDEGRLAREKLDALYVDALRDTLARFEETGSPIITDGEQTRPSFATHPAAGLRNLAPDGVSVPFADGDTRQLPRLVMGPFSYKTNANSFLETAKKYTDRPVKQAVISASLNFIPRGLNSVVTALIARACYLWAKPSAPIALEISGHHYS
jgi:5-methyltetrahydropteroyltriglutamate--homocysteine methyltransferase